MSDYREQLATMVADCIREKFPETVEQYLKDGGSHHMEVQLPRVMGGGEYSIRFQGRADMMTEQARQDFNKKRLEEADGS